MQPALVFIHGFMGHPSDWDPIRAALPEYETHAVEIGVTKTWHSALETLAASLPEQSIVVGYSMGARLALGLVLEMPQKVAGLIFISGNPGLESENDREQRWITDQQIAARLEFESLEPFLQTWYQADVFETVPEEVRNAEIERKMACSSEAWPEILLANSVAKQPNYWAQLSKIAVPTLVVAGELDEKYKRIAARFAEQCSSNGLETRIVKECGHIVHREQPETLLQILREFVDQKFVQ